MSADHETDLDAESNHVKLCAELYQTKYAKSFSISAALESAPRPQTIAGSPTASSSSIRTPTASPNKTPRPIPSSTASSRSNTSMFSQANSEASYFDGSQPASSSQYDPVRDARRLPPPSSLADKDINRQRFALYISAYFVRHSSRPHCATSLLASRELDHFAKKLAEKNLLAAASITRSGHQRSPGRKRAQLTGSFQSSKSSSTQPSKYMKPPKSPTKPSPFLPIAPTSEAIAVERLKATNAALQQLVADGTLVPVAEPPSIAKKNAQLQRKLDSHMPSPIKLRPEQYFALFDVPMLAAPLYTVFLGLFKHYAAYRTEGIPFNTILRELKEVEDGKWRHLQDEDVQEALRGVESIRCIAGAKGGKWVCVT